MLTGVKFAALGAVLGALGGIDAALEGIILVAAAGASAGWLYVRVLRPIAGAARRTYHGVEALEDLPPFMAEQREVNAAVSDRLEQGSENFRLLNERLTLAERAAWSVASDTGRTAEHTQALIRELDVPSRHSDLSDT